MSGLGNDKASNLTNLMYTLQIASAPDKRLRIAQRLRQHCEIESREMAKTSAARCSKGSVENEGEHSAEQPPKKAIKIGKACLGKVESNISFEEANLKTLGRGLRPNLVGAAWRILN